MAVMTEPHARALAPALLCAALAACSANIAAAPDAGTGDAGVASFESVGRDALATLENSFLYAQSSWHICLPSSAGCGTSDTDWGADSLTYALALRWSLTQDPGIPPLLSALSANAPGWGACRRDDCPSWSDVPMWDSIAAAREYQATGEAPALSRAKAAFAFVDGATEFALGACPSISYQQPQGGGNHLKTLETDSNYIKAALLLYQFTQNASYETKAIARYRSVRQYFLDPAVPLYSVYVFDDGATCAQEPHRFFASVNGNMIWSGIALAAATGDASYLAEATATAQAVAQDLGDGAGLYVDMQAENDVVEPLVEAMLLLATDHAQAYARTWILVNAAAAEGSDRLANGAYGRFFNGPATPRTISQWQSNGGLALAIAAASLAPEQSPDPDAWLNASYVVNELSSLPSSLTFTGSAIALVGTIGDQCCEDGHASVFVDGTETFDRTGIWQNKSSSDHSLDNSILFAWRFAAPGAHTLDFKAPDTNGKEGHPFLHLRGYYFVP
jgi:hypothetical protein